MKKTRTAAAALAAVLLLAGCENALQLYVLQTLFGSAYTEQVARLVPGGANNAHFGFSVDVDGDTVIVGEPGAASATGAAYVYRRSGDSWGAPEVLTASDGAADDEFGASVAVSGDYAVVAAPRKDVAPLTNVGGIYIFQRSGTNTWTEVAKFTLTGVMGTDYPDGSDRFGSAVSIAGKWIAVGAREDNLGGGANDDRGAVYMFERTGSWAYANEKLDLGTAPETLGANFGFSLRLLGSNLIVGAHNETDGGLDRGAAYIYQIVIDDWQLVERITPPDPADNALFGASVAMTEDRAVVGAPWKNVGGLNLAGVGYFFQRGSGGWSGVTPVSVSPETSAVSDWTGMSAAISGETALIGSPLHDAAGSDLGAATLYRLDGGNNWRLGATLAPADSPGGFGISVALGPDYAVVGATDPLAYPSGAPGAVYIYR